MSPKSKLSPAGRGGLASPSQKVIHGFDRIKLWLDHPDFPESLDPMREHCTKIKPYWEQMPYQARWKFRLEIFQPTTECLCLIEAALSSHISVNINYVEIAADFPAESAEQALSWRDSFLGAARMKSQRQAVELEEHDNIWYYGRRENEDGNKRGKVLAVYADKPSKLLNAPEPPKGTPPCLHLESRATGADSVSSLEIVTLQDLIAFQHEGFWTKHISLFELPNKTEMGRLLASANETNTEVSTTALWKAATKWIAKASIDDIFVMHNALLGRPDIAKKLQTIPFWDWANKTIL